MSDFILQSGTPLDWADMNYNLQLIQSKYLDSANNAAIAIAAASFKGNWSALTGPLTVPAAVYHSSKFWLLLSNLADVTAKEPGVDSEWLEIITGNVMGPASATAGNLATLDATGKVLSDGGVAPAALMPKAGGTFTGAVSVPAAATGAQAPQVQEVVKKAGDTLTGVLGVVAGTAAAPGIAVSGDANTGIYSPGADQLAVATGGVLALSVEATGGVLARSGGMGYGTGAGGTVTQGTSKTTAVTLNKPSGRITMHNAALAAGASVVFVVNNTAVTQYDVVVLNGIWTAVNPTSYRIEIDRITSSGTFHVRVTNISAGSLSEALAINFAVIKGAIA